MGDEEARAASSAIRSSGEAISAPPEARLMKRCRAYPYRFNAFRHAIRQSASFLTATTESSLRESVRLGSGPELERKLKL